MLLRLSYPFSLCCSLDKPIHWLLTLLHIYFLAVLCCSLLLLLYSCFLPSYCAFRDSFSPPSCFCSKDSSTLSSISICTDNNSTRPLRPQTTPPFHSIFLLLLLCTFTPTLSDLLLLLYTYTPTLIRTAAPAVYIYSHSMRPAAHAVYTTTLSDLLLLLYTYTPTLIRTAAPAVYIYSHSIRPAAHAVYTPTLSDLMLLLYVYTPTLSDLLLPLFPD
jgi:hypothetical protein